MNDIIQKHIAAQMESIVRHHECDAMTLIELGHSMNDLQIVHCVTTGREEVTTKRATEGMPVVEMPDD